MSLKIDFVEFEESPDKYYSYTGAIVKTELDDSEGKSQLVNVNNNLGIDQPYIFLEE